MLLFSRRRVSKILGSSRQLNELLDKNTPQNRANKQRLYFKNLATFK